jgi:uncharacterized protein YndB with AHSA1/START domain
MSVLDSRPLFDLAAEVHIAASPHTVYNVVSKMERHAEWSSELRAGEWISGNPGEPGSIFRGENFRGDDVVTWAPLIRGVWHTKSEIVTTDPGRVFRWKIHSKTGEPQELVWSFEMEPHETGCTLAQRFRMGYVSPGIHDITKDMDEEEKKKFISDWHVKMRRDIKATLEKIKSIVEKE